MENILTINDCEVLVDALDKYERSKKSNLMPENIIPFSLGDDMNNELITTIKQEMERTRQEKQRAYEEAKETSTLLKARLIMLKKDLQSENIKKLVSEQIVRGNNSIIDRETKTPEQ